MILASGIGNAWLRLSGPSDLWTTAYGRLLSVKIALFGIVVALAAMYRAFYLPRLTNAEVRARFWRVLSVDLGALVAIIAIAVVLSGTAPPVPIVPLGTAVARVPPHGLLAPAGAHGRSSGSSSGGSR